MASSYTIQDIHALTTMEEALNESQTAFSKTMPDIPVQVTMEGEEEALNKSQTAFASQQNSHYITSSDTMLETPVRVTTETEALNKSQITFASQQNSHYITPSDTMLETPFRVTTETEALNKSQTAFASQQNSHYITSSDTMLETPFRVTTETEALNKKRVTFADQRYPYCTNSSENNDFYITGKPNKTFNTEVFNPLGENHTIELGNKEKNNYQHNSAEQVCDNSTLALNVNNSTIKKSSTFQNYHYHQDIIDIISIETLTGNITIGKNIETDKEIIIQSYEKPKVNYNKLSLKEDSNNITILLPDKFFDKKEIFLNSKHGNIATESGYILKTSGKIKTYNSDINVQIDNDYIYPHCRIEHGVSKIRGSLINSSGTKKLLLESHKGNLDLEIFYQGKISLATIEKKSYPY